MPFSPAAGQPPRRKSICQTHNAVFPPNVLISIQTCATSTPALTTIDSMARATQGEEGMMRRDFLYGSAAAAGAALLPRTLAYAETADVKPIDAKAFHASRKFATLPVTRFAYVERGRGQAALSIHGYALNGFQC